MLHVQPAEISLLRRGTASKGCRQPLGHHSTSLPHCAIRSGRAEGASGAGSSSGAISSTQSHHVVGLGREVVHVYRDPVDGRRHPEAGALELSVPVHDRSPGAGITNRISAELVVMREQDWQEEQVWEQGEGPRAGEGGQEIECGRRSRSSRSSGRRGRGRRRGKSNTRTIRGGRCRTGSLRRRRGGLQQQQGFREGEEEE